MATIDEACKTYMKLLRDTEELTQEARTLARESFIEGWIQCERANPIIKDYRQTLENSAKKQA